MHRLLPTKSENMRDRDCATAEEHVERIRNCVTKNKRSLRFSIDDMVHEIIVELLEEHEKLDVDDATLQRIVNKHFSRERRALKKRPESWNEYIHDEDAHPAARPETGVDEVDELVLDFCKTLPARLRPVASMMFTHSNADIARRLGMAESNVSRDLKSLYEKYFLFQDNRLRAEGIHRRKPRDRWIFDTEEE